MRPLPVLALLFAAPAFAAPPVAPVHPITTNYYGTEVTDDYRWMEAPDSAPLAAYLKAQADYTNTVLAKIPVRMALAAEVDKLSNSGTALFWLTEAGDNYFYMQQGPGQNVALLYVRNGLHGAAHVLVDPMKRSQDGGAEALNFYQPSQDGKYVAYGVSAGGSENAILRVVRVTDGADMGVAISRTDGDNDEIQPVFWAPDGRSFFYYRLQALAKNADPAGYFLKSRAFLHVLGKNPAGDGDAPIFGYGVNPAVPVRPDQDSVVVTIPGSPYAFGVLTENESDNLIDDIWAAKLTDITTGHTVWTRLVTKGDNITGFTARGQKIYLLTSTGAPHFRVVQTSIAAPDFVHGKVAVPASSAVITNIAMGKDALYAQAMQDGMGRIIRLPATGGAATQVAMPFSGSIGALTASPDLDGVLFDLSGWTRPDATYQALPDGTVADVGLQPKSGVDFSNIVSLEVKAVSWDGTMVPLSIVMKQGTKLDGTHPTWLMGYGSYGITLTPYFDPTLLAWLNRGGIFAVAHIRGGGWYGDAWHKAGMKLSKVNTWEDFIACAQYLVDEGYTAPAHLAGEGGSAGGITIGRAIETRPDLFAAAIDSHGETDNLRSEFTPNGPPNISEFGSVTDEAGFHGLYAMSAQAHLRRGVKYPAVLTETGDNDPRVEPWEVAKFTAGLQADSTSGKPILMHVEYGTGHGIFSTKAEADDEEVDEMAFLLWQLGNPQFQPIK